MRHGNDRHHRSRNGCPRDIDRLGDHDDRRAYFAWITCLVCGILTVTAALSAVTVEIITAWLRG